MPKLPLYPLTFEPFFRPMPWGGQRLRRWFPDSFPKDQKIGEAWLLSDHTLHASRIANGPLAGQTLRQLMAERGEELLGFPAERFPLLIKLLDAHENLSVQVHPDDEAAKRWAPHEGGKTEAWVILDAEPDAELYLGLKRGIDKATFARELIHGNAPDCLNRFTPQPGEFWFVPAGTVHALGRGVVVLEVQQTSDATFRLYDWGRVGEDGRPRKLHIEEGLACLKPEIDGASLRSMASREPSARLVKCDYFDIIRSRARRIAKIPAGLLIGLEGDGTIRTGATETSLAPGQLVLLSGDGLSALEAPKDLTAIFVNLVPRVRTPPSATA